MSRAADPEAPYVRLAVVALISREHGEPRRTQWLLLHREEPFTAWDPPGGRMERGEDLRSAVTREVEEETGLSVRVGGPCYAYLTLYKGERLLAVSMACRVDGDSDRVRLEPGASGWRWASAEEWAGLAGAGSSSWSPEDVAKATSMASTLWGVTGG